MSRSATKGDTDFISVTVPVIQTSLPSLESLIRTVVPIDVEIMELSVGKIYSANAPPPDTTDGLFKSE